MLAGLIVDQLGHPTLFNVYEPAMLATPVCRMIAVVKDGSRLAHPIFKALKSVGYLLNIWCDDYHQISIGALPLVLKQRRNTIPFSLRCCCPLAVDNKLLFIAWCTAGICGDDTFVESLPCSSPALRRSSPNCCWHVFE